MLQITPHLASHILGQMAKRIPRDWQRLYAHPIYWLLQSGNLQRSRPPLAPPSYWETSLSSMVRLLSSGRWPIGDPARRIPSTVGAAAVARYFKIEDEWAQTVRLKLLARKNDATQPGQ